MKYIIDTDPGIDDAVAIVMAMKNKLNIIGFTLASGNIPLDKSINNLKIIEDFMESNIPIFKGKTINKSSATAEYAHGKDGLGYAVFPENKTRRVEKQSAEEFIIKASKKYKDDLTLICLGPLTNLAGAIKMDPTLPKRLKKIIIMSATYNPESTEVYKEFNILVDPKAAKIVYEAPFEEIKAITHEIGVKAFIEKDYMENLKHSDDKISRFISIIGEKYIEFSFDHYGTIGLQAPDPITIASILDPSIVSFSPFKIEISTEGNTRGESYATPCENSHIYLSTDFNLDKFRELFKNTFK
ncbi:MAG: nucleoside hydrolase [Bacilli bacterium]|nr:nucleoside hydrolase [Bacilli bacterium]